MRYLLLVLVSLCLFESALGQVVPVNNIETAKGYTMGPGDVVRGTVAGEDVYNFLSIVDENGLLEVPFSDKPLMARCRTEAQLKTELIGMLGKWLRKPQLSLQIERKSRPPVTIHGEVNRPQQILLMRKARLNEVLAAAEGVKEEAGGLIQVFRTQPPMCGDANDEDNWKPMTADATEVPSRTFNLADVRLAKEEANPIIYPGDVVVVQKAAPVYITGEVVSPQGIYLKEGGLSLTEALAKIGGVRREAKTKDIKIYRLKPNSKDRDVISANYDQIKKGTQKDLMLQPYDIVEVDKAKESILSAVFKLAMGAGKTVLLSGSSSLGYKVLY